MESKQTRTGLKIYGQGKAQVISVKKEGPDNHKVRVTHPDIGLTKYIPFIQTPGIYRVPKLGDSCYIFFDENFHQYPIAWGHRLDEEDVKSLIGDRQDDITILYSSGADQASVGQKIELDDAEETAGIRILSFKGNKVEMLDDKDIVITHQDGATTTVGKDKIELNIKNNLITMKESGIILEDKNGNKISLGEEGITIESSKGSKVVVGETITGDAADKLSKIDEVIVSTHPHTGNLGIPTGPPVPNA